MPGRTTYTQVGLDTDESVLGLAIGDRIRVRAAESERLSAGFFTEIAVRFAPR